MPVLSSSRNQSIDLHGKSIDWFLYKGKTGTLYINHTLNLLIHVKDISSKKILGRNYFVDLSEVNGEVYQCAGKKTYRIWH